MKNEKFEDKEIFTQNIKTINEERLELIDIVDDFNLIIFAKDEDNYEPAFFYSTNGTTDTISFYGKVLWNSDDDDREWLEEIQDYEPLKPFLLKKLNIYIDGITIMSFLLRGNK